MKGSFLTEAEIIALLKKRQGVRDQNEIAASIGVSPKLISEIYRRRRSPGGKKIMEFLGLEKVVVYRSITRPASSS